MKDVRVGANIWGLLNRERGSGLHHVEIRSAGPGIYLLAVCKRISMTVHTYYIVFTNFDISRPQYLYTWSGRLTSTSFMHSAQSYFVEIQNFFSFMYLLGHFDLQSNDAYCLGT